MALVRQWQGSSASPLDPDKILKEVAELLRPYRCSNCFTDEWSSDANRSLALQHGLYLQVILSSDGKSFRMKDKVAGYDGISSALAMNEKGHHDRRSLELHPCHSLLSDLGRIVRRTTQSGVVIDVPVSADGRHCDFAEALARVYTQVLQRPVEAASDEDPLEILERADMDRMSREQESKDARDADDTSYDELVYEEDSQAFGMFHLRSMG